MNLKASGALPTYHNLVLSLQVYSQAIIDTVGWPVLLMALIGLGWFVLHFRFSIKTLPVYVALVLVLFNLYSLYTGNSAILTPEYPVAHISTYWNGRYGMVAIPVVVLFLAAWVSMHRKIFVLVLVPVLMINGFALALSTPYALQEPLHGLTAEGRIWASDEGHWLASHYHGGDILISSGGFDAAIFYSGLPMSVFLTQSSTNEFHAALANPERSVTWIVMDTQSVKFEPVWTALHNRQDWRKDFVLREVIGTAQIYERVASS